MGTKSLILLLALAISLPGFSQLIEGKNMAKVNASAFALKGFNIQYERQVGPRITVALGYANIPTSSLPYQAFIQKQVDDPQVKVSDFRLGTSIITPEARYYFGKNGAYHGFYIAPYARIGSYNVSGPIEYSTSTNFNNSALFSGKLKTFTGGIMIGSSFQLSERLYLDWWIIGASIGGANGNLVAATQLTPDEQESLKNTLDQVDVPFTTIQSKVNGNGAVITTSGTMIGLRGLGLNLGFRF